MVSVTLALLVLIFMDSAMSTMLAVDCSTVAACSEADCDSDCAVAETWPTAPLSESVVVTTSLMVCDSFFTMRSIESCSSPISSLRSTRTRIVRSPPAQ